MSLALYKVLPGDTIFAICRKFSMAVADFLSLNTFTLSTVLKVGQLVKVNTKKTTVAPPPPPPPPPPVRPVTGTVIEGWYIVKLGDTYYGIASRAKMSVPDLLKLNNIGNPPSPLKIGQKIKVRVTKDGTLPPPPAPVPTPSPNPTPIPPPTPPPPFIPEDAVLERIAAARRVYNIAKEPRTDSKGIAYNLYTLKAPHPDGANTIIAKFRDNVQSVYKMYTDGISYAGMSLPDFPLSFYESVGLSGAQAKALQFVSKHEGKFDAINSFDKAIFSFGFIQFTGSAVSAGGSLGYVLCFYKKNAPALFNKYFKAVGIDVDGEYLPNTDSFKLPTVKVKVTDIENNRVLEGDNAWHYIRKNVALYAPFIQSAYITDFIREQLRAACRLYVSAALNLKLTVNIAGVPIQIPAISQVLNSESAATMLIDLGVNQGMGGLGRLLQAILPIVADELNIKSLNDLKQIDERKVLDTIVAKSTDGRVKTRTQNIINANLSFEKA